MLSGIRLHNILCQVFYADRNSPNHIDVISILKCQLCQLEGEHLGRLFTFMYFERKCIYCGYFICLEYSNITTEQLALSKRI